MTGCPKISSPKNWKGQDDEEDPGKDGKRSRKTASSAESEKMDRDGDRQGKNGRTLFKRPKPTAGCSAN
jgi:hypothetical protein